MIWVIYLLMLILTRCVRRRMERQGLRKVRNQGEKVIGLIPCPMVASQSITEEMWRSQDEEEIYSLSPKIYLLWKYTTCSIQLYLLYIISINTFLYKFSQTLKSLTHRKARCMFILGWMKYMCIQGQEEIFLHIVAHCSLWVRIT
jgi:hypothetical protein